MVSPVDIGKSVIYAVLLIAILSVIWPYLPKTGPFSSLTRKVNAVAVVAIGFIVIGPGRVAWDILMGNDGW